MKAEEIIPATHRLEHSGMNRNEAEAVIVELQKVVAPLATKDGLAKLERSMTDLERSMATKDNLAKLEQSMATKDNLAKLKQSMATKDDLAKLKQSMATKDDLAKLKQSMATKDDLANLEKTMATKVDVARMEIRLFRSLAATMLAVGALVLSVLRFFPPA